MIDRIMRRIGYVRGPKVVHARMLRNGIAKGETTWNSEDGSHAKPLSRDGTSLCGWVE